MKTHNLFVSHSWTYEDAYDRLCNFLDERSYFAYNNYSVPKDDPIHDAPNQTALRNAIVRQIQPCHVVLIMAGVYSTYSKWINIELDIAKNHFNLPKPVIGIRPWAQRNVSSVVQDGADEIVSWNTDSIVGAIRRHSS